jgi:UDP-N-acetylmuramoylalanine--D-glutamate ligase
MMNIAGGRALILGLGREGASLASFLADGGADVTVTDSAPAESLAGRSHDLPPTVRLVLGGDHPELVRDADRFFTSPGVPESSPVYAAARGRGLVIESMTTLFFERCQAPIVGITGSSGKTTTTSLLGHVLKGSGRDVLVAGNIGDPMIDLLPRIASDSVVVLELSSFQLSILSRSPHIALVTNLSPNHLDRHDNMDAYVAAKRRIVERQSPGDFAVLNADDHAVSGFARSTSASVTWFGTGATKGALLEADRLILARGSVMRPVMLVSDIPLLGSHNVQNVLAACAVADLLGVSPASMAEGIGTFEPPAHRLQLVKKVLGVRYIDDSIATSPSRAVAAVDALGGPAILIAGGRDKRLPWSDFARTVARRARALLLIGEAAQDIDAAVRREIDGSSGLLRRDAIFRCGTLDEAVSKASRLAQSGDTVLLAPGCTSYDMFRDFEERGDAFARAVGELDAA